MPKKTIFEINENKDLEKGWKEFPMPSYQFNQNTVGIWLKMGKMWNDYGQSDAPEIRENTTKSTKYSIVEKLGLKQAVKKPIAFLSVNELPALLYALLIENKTSKEIEKTIELKIFSLRNEIRSFETATNTNIKLPKKLLKSGTKLKIDVEKLKQSITRSITNEKEENNPLKKIRKKYKKEVKNPNELSTSEKGKIATWLADDIKRFTSKDTKKDWKGYQYAEFQALFSFYDIDKKRPQDFLKNDLNYNFKKDNIFNGINFKKSTLFEFYRFYLGKRDTYLKNLLKQINNDTLPENIFRGFTKRKYNIEPTKTQTDRLLNNIPVNLPRGLFDNKPTSYKKENKGSSELANWFKKSSQLGNAQQFYSFEKTYNQQTIKPNKGLKAQYNNNLPLVNQKEIYKNETRIRKMMREDYFVLEMAKSLLKKQNVTGIEDITLKDVFLTKEEKNSIQVESKNQSKRVVGDKTENIVNDSDILSKKITTSILDGKVIGEVKIKNIGKSQKLQTDQRVKQLTDYNTDKTWSFTEINDELEDYDRVRKFEFFKTVHSLEKEIYVDARKNNRKEELLNKDNPNFKKYLSYYFLKTDKEKFNNLNLKKISVTHSSVQPAWEKLFLLAKIRNKFSHNQLLPKEDFEALKRIIPKDDNEYMATYLNRAFKQIDL